MKKLKLTKIISSLLIAVSVLVLKPIGASAEWRSDSTGWWYTEGNSWVTGWRNISGSWYYFNSDGYMAHDTTIDGYYLNSSGAWGNNISNTYSKNDNVQIVNFADKNLEQAVRDKINKPTGILYKSDTDKITELNAIYRDIVDINGIQYLTNLQKLDLSCNQASNLSVLKELTNLKYLEFNKNQIKNINHQSLEVLYAALPNCRVFFNGGIE